VKFPRGRAAALIAGWMALASGGMVAFAWYGGRAGDAASAPAQWPAASHLRLDAQRPTLLMLAHPKCPCTRASLAELARLARRLDGRAALHVLFIHPDGTPTQWERSDLWSQAQAIPGVQVEADPNAEEASRFGGETSGQVLLYAPDGRLAFAGGITSSRGHEGDSPGADRIFEWVTRGATALATAPVFGCPLHDPAPREKP
jgi:hypothetical protein